MQHTVWRLQFTTLGWISESCQESRSWKFSSEGKKPCDYDVVNAAWLGWPLGSTYKYQIIILYTWILCCYSQFKKIHCRLSWQLSGEESDCQCRTRGSDPLSGKITHASEQLSPCSGPGGPQLLRPGAAATEARLPRACAPRGKPLRGGARTPQPEGSPRSNQDQHGER